MPARNRTAERKRRERRANDAEAALRRHCAVREPGDQTPHGYYRESSVFAYGCPLCYLARREAASDIAAARMRGV